jgi:hypothetical protein
MEGRGVPIVGAGASAIRGTDPLNAAIANERRSERYRFVVGAKVASDLPPLPPPRKRRPKGRRVLPPNGRFF